MKAKSPRPRWLGSTHLLDALEGGVLAINAEGEIVYATVKAQGLLGLDEDALVGRELAKLLSAESRERLEIRMQKKLAAGASLQEDVQFGSPTGQGAWVRVCISAVQSEGRVAGALATLTDISDFGHALVEQHALRAQFKAVFENLPFECWLMQRDGRVLMQNERSIQRLGSVLRKTIESAGLAEETLQEFRADLALANAGTEARRQVTMSIDGGRRYFNRLLVPIRDEREILGVLGLCVDRTERRNLQRELVRFQNLDYLGRLAGGIAHDINNALTAIMSCARLLERRLEGPPRRELQIIRDGAQRASELGRQLLACSKQETMEPKRVKIDEIVVNSDRQLRRLIGRDIELVTTTEAEGWDVAVEPVRLEQAIINLAVNARDALPKGGKITLRSVGLALRTSRQATDRTMPPGSYAGIVVEDSGVGMSEETKGRAFEPFFTTRQALGATGLGLSSVYASVLQSKGYITLKSAPGEGTSIGLYFPRASESEIATGGDETILLVQNEAMVSSVISQALRLNGYTVLEARGMPGALEVAASHQGAIDLLLTDVVISQGTGTELAMALRKQRPGISVLVMSASDPDCTDVEIDALIFLAKPISPGELELQIRNVLDRSGA